MAYEDYFKGDPTGQKYARMLQYGKQPGQGYSLPWLKDPSQDVLNTRSGLMSDALGAENSARFRAAQQKPFIEPGQEGKEFDPALFGNGVMDNSTAVQSSGLVQRGNNPMSDAIASKYQSMADRGISDIKSAYGTEKIMHASNKLGEANDLSNKIQSIKQRNTMQSWAYDAAKDQLNKERDRARAEAEAAFISSVFGVAGSVGAIAVSGGAATPLVAANAAQSLGGKTPGRSY